MHNYNQINRHCYENVRNPSLLNESHEIAPSLELQYTYAEDYGCRHPHPHPLPPATPFTSAEAIAVGNQVGVSERTAKCYFKELDKGQFISRLKMKHSQRCYAKIL
ncbi:MAG: hypothetical protein IJZ31_01995 [Bacteroidaceae bacterium]|nr:hypothetical protein [Bacteroidaceae bacterium]